MTEELKPCPFCGSEAEVTGSGIAGRIRIECSNRPCQNSREVYTTSTPATEAWNNRSSWQPIETAPKDGTWIVAWDGCEHAILAWSKNIWIWNLAGEEAFDGWTHWQPLPDPPEEE